MSIEQLGSLGEFISAIAVIASVLYLALQIRHSAASASSAAIHAVTSHFSRMQFDTAANAELSEVLVRASAGGVITPVEEARLHMLYGAYMIAFENLWEQHRAGVLSEASFDARRVVIAQQLAGVRGRQWWEAYGRCVHPAQFVAAVDEIIADSQQLLAGLRSSAATDG